MLILRHNELSSEDLFVIERRMIKVADPKYKVQDLQHFTVMDKSRAELYGYILGFSERLGLCDSIGVTPSELLDFIVDVDHGYLPNAYHSFYHAVDVAIVLYHMVSQYDVALYLSRIDMAALIIAGLCHDIGHPGKNNNFQVNLKTDLAIRYSNKSVLESYSCTITMDLLTKHKLLKQIEKASGSLGLPTSEPEMRTSIIKMILATDMIFHYELQENLANLLEIIHSDHTTPVADEGQQKGRLPHKPSLPTTTEEEEEEEEEEEQQDDCDNEEAQEQNQQQNSGGGCQHSHTPSIVFSTTSASSTTEKSSAISTSPETAEKKAEEQQKEDEQAQAAEQDEEEEEEDDIQVKDIFSTQGAKSAISYFRKKSYFEEDMIPLCLKNMPTLPISPEEDEEDEAESILNEDLEFNSNRSDQHHHTSGVDLVTSTIQVNGVEKLVYTPPNYIMEPQQRLILCQIVLHAADISNALRPWPICYAWSNLVCEEFFTQGEAERDNGLQVSPNMDRNSVSQTTIGLRFGDFVVSPYFEIFAALFSRADEMLATLAENRQQWLKMEEEEKQKEEAEAEEAEEEFDDEKSNSSQRLPSSMLPDRPILNPSGRRVSVAAGMVIIPDELEERTIGSGKNKRKYWGFRSVSHSNIDDFRKRNKTQEDQPKRRKSEEPTNAIMLRNKLLASGSRSPPGGSRKSSSRERKSSLLATGTVVQE